MDLSWPQWALGKFEVKYYIDECKLGISSDNLYGVHPIFESRPKEVVLKSTDHRSALCIGDDHHDLGELWLRAAFSLPKKFFGRTLFCETYQYRRGFRDALTAQMDEQPAGHFILPTREDDLRCTISKPESQIDLHRSTFVVRLSKLILELT